MSHLSKYCQLAITFVALVGTLSAAAQTAPPETRATSKSSRPDKSSPTKSSPYEATPKTFLHKDWQVQSSCDDKSPAERISTAGFDASKWHKTDLPATVIAVLVGDKTLPDPNYGTNLQNYQGFYGGNDLFANLDMPQGSPYICSWWFRTEFKLPLIPGSLAGKNKTDWLHFNGINYRANIWLNGQKIADNKDAAGTYRTLEYNVTKSLKHDGAKNTLALEISAPGKDDLGITWVDWNPTPPDKNMGIWKEVFLTQTSDVTVRNPFVASKLSSDYKSAQLTVYADLQNFSDKPVKGTLKAEFDKVKISSSSHSRRQRIQNHHLHSRKIRRPQTRPSASLVAIYHRRPLPLPRKNFLRHRRQNQRLRHHQLRHPRSNQRSRRQEFPPFQNQRPQHPDPRLGLGS